MPAGKHFTAGFHLVNGWNNVEDNNSGKTIGLTGALTAGPVTWSNNYYAGPEKAGVNQGWRHLYDTTLLVSGSKASAYLNFDYGVDKNPAAASNVWYGVAGAARFALTDHFAISPRLEWFNDRDGFSTGMRAETQGVHPDGRVQNDTGRCWGAWSTEGTGPTSRSSTAALRRASSSTRTPLLVGVVAYFGPK